MADKKISTIEELGDVVLSIDERLKTHITDSTERHREIRETFKSIGDHLLVVENHLERIDTRLDHLELAKLQNRVARLEDIVRDKLHVEV